MGSDDDGPGPDDDDHSPARENSDGWCANDLGYGDCAINDPTANRSARDDYFDYQSNHHTDTADGRHTCLYQLSVIFTTSEYCHTYQFGGSDLSGF